MNSINPQIFSVLIDLIIVTIFISVPALFKRSWSLFSVDPVCRNESVPFSTVTDLSSIRRGRMSVSATHFSSPHWMSLMDMLHLSKI